MTILEELVAERTRVAVGSAISRTTELIAEQMANEILRDPDFRAEMQTLIRQAFGETVRTLRKPQVRRRR